MIIHSSRTKQHFIVEKKRKEKKRKTKHHFIVEKKRKEKKRKEKKRKEKKRKEKKRKEKKRKEKQNIIIVLYAAEAEKQHTKLQNCKTTLSFDNGANLTKYRYS
jgi:hypothetical protein